VSKNITSVLITGAGGYIGRIVVKKLAALKASDDAKIDAIVATDVRETPKADQIDGVTYVTADIRSRDLAAILEEHKVDVVAHLAAMVSAGKKDDRELLYSIDVLGTKNVLECCLAAKVSKIIVTSSGASYGYYADNPDWLDENDALRGNVEMPYSDNKRQVEEMLSRWRRDHPQLKQLILRPGTVLGDTAANQITALFDGRVVMGLRGAAIPFVLIWDDDVAEIIVVGATSDKTGIFNLAGDGALTMQEMAKMLGKPFVPLPVTLVKGALWGLSKLGLSSFGPEQVNFLRYRPVLANRRLKEEFGYIPRKTTREVFEYFLETRSRAQA